jgi:group II intron reverse transcriptase/maturase
MRGGLSCSSDEAAVMAVEQRAQVIQFQESGTTRERRKPLYKTKSKPFDISKWKVQRAFEQVKANRGTAGIDGQSIAAFEENLKDNLYKLWNRMSSGTYFPPPVKAVAIPKKNGGTRKLGIPTVSDRIAQATVRAYLEEEVEPMFLANSYGYRPGKSAHEALAETRKRCWKYDWVLEFDIVGLFDNIDHELLMGLVKQHAKQRWVELYIKRWLTVPFDENGTLVERTSGTPQGGVISPLLANLFLHYVFDSYMVQKFPSLVWARYADDGVVHCKTKKQALYLKDMLAKRFARYKLELHPDKTRIVYCGSDRNIRKQELHSFDFLGYTFRPRGAKDKYGELFCSFMPAIADKAKKAMRREITGWMLQRQIALNIEDIAKAYNAKIRGWVNYYGKFYPSEVKGVLNHINVCLCKWVKSKYKKHGSWRKAWKWLGWICKRNPKLFYHWEIGVVPSTG